MAKKAVKRKPAPRQRDAELETVAAARARLRRLIAARRDVARLARELRTVIQKADRLTFEFARDVASEMNLELAPIKQAEPERELELARHG